MLTLLAGLAFADTVTLDTGATLAADLARYELDGDCQMTVTEGELTGAILILPCHRVKAFDRTTPAVPVVMRAQPVAPPAPVAPAASSVAAEVVVLEVPVAPEAAAPALETPRMPDSIAALEADDFITPFPAADAAAEEAVEAFDVEAEAEPAAEEAEEPEAEEAAAEETAAPEVSPEAPEPDLGPGVPREAPTMGRIDHDVEF